MPYDDWGNWIDEERNLDNQEDGAVYNELAPSQPDEAARSAQGEQWNEQARQDPTFNPRDALIERDTGNWEEQLRAAGGGLYDPSDLAGVQRQVSYAQNAGRDPQEFINAAIREYAHRQTNEPNEGMPRARVAPQSFGGGGGGAGGGGGGGPQWGTQIQDYMTQLLGQQNSAQQQMQQYLQAQLAAQQADQARRKSYEDQVRNTIMGIMGQKPQTADEIANSPEARAYSRLGERSQQQLRAQQAERAAQMGVGAVAGGGQPQTITPAQQAPGQFWNPGERIREGGPEGMTGGNQFQAEQGRGGGGLWAGPDGTDRSEEIIMANQGNPEPATGGPAPSAQPQAPAGGGGGGTLMGGALRSAVEGGSRDLAERNYAIQAQMMNRELEGRRQQLMQTLQLGAGLMTADQQRDLQRELSQIQASLQQQNLNQAGILGSGQLSLGLLGAQNQNDQFYSGLGADLGYKQALLNQNPFQYLF